MSRLNEENLRIARQIISAYPKKKSALIPLLHLAQEQNGLVTNEAMTHIAELVDVTPAEVLGTCSFYEMFKRHPVGEYQINICHGISCHLLGAEDVLEHAESSLGVKEGEITQDGKFSFEGVECIAACTEAPCLQVNYRYINKVNADEFDQLIDDLRNETKTEIPKHGTLANTRQKIPANKAAGPAQVEESSRPIWLKRNKEE
ncbi:MAG: NAD(P)H-dependent oxidoreductase subunit E [Acidimicrobiaceae bacterium]|nr:NAD(P)H-dependent oxidoreductase subunit E [Acidimicrobiaceae bacterium]|tara:strand:+ start:501 stop:1109 length:609 start_codon:yes stop_codon:yes gene_type:complete